MKIYKGEEYERNLKITKRLIWADKENKAGNKDISVSGEALKLAFEYKITPQRCVAIYKNYLKRGVISQ